MTAGSMATPARAGPAPRPARITALAPLLLVACTPGSQSALESAGAGAARVELFWWAMLGGTAAAWLLTMAVLAWALLHRGSRESADPAHVGTLSAPETEQERRIARTIGGAALVTALLLFAIFGGSLWVDGAIASETEEAPLVVDVVGRQWWWAVHYRDSRGRIEVTTANELHLPVGRTVELRLRTDDVIHSFWVPNIAGKLDLIPGKTNTLRIRAHREGVFRGQCAEYCGLQHAGMAMLTVVRSPEEFDGWLAQQRQPSLPPADSLARRGRDVFLHTSCALCHAVRGTSARATVGPDLTHLASRRTLAAGLLQNVRGNLAGWILDPQRIKPGAHMPATNLRSDELHALLAYLETLQ